MDDLIKYGSNIPARYTGAETAVIDAMQNSEKIYSMSISDISVQLSKSLTRAYIDAGFQLPGKETMLILSNSVADDLVTYFKILTIKEAGLAIQNGIRGEYGEYMGINVKTCHQFFKAYQESFNRTEAIRKQAIKEEPEERLTDAEIFEIMNEACRTSFTKYKESGELIDFGGAKFNHLKKIGLISLTPERYDEIFQRAKQQVIAEANTNLLKSDTYPAIADLAKNLLKSPDKHETTKNAARLIALREYFDYLIEFEFDLSEKIEAINTEIKARQ